MKKMILFMLVCQASLLPAGNKKEEGAMPGMGLVYNFQTNGTGMSMRVLLPVLKGFSFVPRFSYYFAFNEIQEYYINLDLRYRFLKEKSWQPYLMYDIGYNRWQNYANFEGSLAVPNNIAAECGVGIQRASGSIRPFAESRYNIKWKEAHLEAGIYWHPNAGNRNKKPGITECPSF